MKTSGISKSSFEGSSETRWKKATNTNSTSSLENGEIGLVERMVFEFDIQSIPDPHRNTKDAEKMII